MTMYSRGSTFENHSWVFGGPLSPLDVYLSFGIHRVGPGLPQLPVSEDTQVLYGNGTVVYTIECISTLLKSQHSGGGRGGMEESRVQGQSQLNSKFEVSLGYMRS